MKFLLRLLVTGILVVLLANLLPGVSTDSYWTAIIVALILGILNLIVRPILVILTLPVTILTLGLFLLVINAFIILMTDGLIDGFSVDGFWWALLFSICLSILQSILDAMVEK
jgi:putative membrane protein